MQKLGQVDVRTLTWPIFKYWDSV